MSELSFVVQPIGVVRSPFVRKVEAPRQARAAAEVEARIELRSDLLHALDDLDGFEHVWVLAWMDRAHGYRSKVLPPRSRKKRGLFATRTPHRPNPIALSVVRLLRVEGTVLHVQGVDLLDGTPVVDVKPYVPWCDAIPRSRTGWLEAETIDEEQPEDPRGEYQVVLEPQAAAQLAWLAERGVELEPTLRTILATSPLPQPYRRIRRAGSGYVIALWEWRARFAIEGRSVRITEVRSGYRAGEMARQPLHRAFTEAVW